MTSAPTGLIEGFYGQVWTPDERTAVLRCLASGGYDFHVYAPKGDKSLRREWQRPFTDEEAEALRALHRTGHALGVDVGVGLSPFEVWQDWGPEAREALAAKLAAITACGARILCLLFDDMRGDVPDLARTQGEIARFVADNASVQRLIVCPTYYSDDPVLARVFGAPPARYLEELGDALPTGADVFWTGPLVCSDALTASHLADVAERLGRKPFLWDNYPVNDGAKVSRFLRLSPAPDRWDAFGAHAAGYAANPMVQPHLSAVPLVGLALVRAGEADGQAALKQALGRLVPPDLAALLLRDRPAFEERGLDDLPQEERERLRADYARFGDDPYAREVRAWLAEDYAFDPACLTD